MVKDNWTRADISLVALTKLRNDMVRRLPLHSEYHRLLTFERWPKPQFNAEKLASEGFFYLGIEDYVACKFCLTAIHNFEIFDENRIRHKAWGPHCPLLKGEKTSNIKIDGYNYLMR